MVEKRTLVEGEGIAFADGVTITQLSRGERLQGQIVEMAPDSRVDTHSHPNEQLTFAVEGTLSLIVDGEEIQLGAGESLLIPGGAEHAAVTEPDSSAVAFDVFSPPREGLPNVE